MADGIRFVGTWHFVRKGSITSDVKKVLIDGENIQCVYQTVRDMAILTDKRLIVRDSQGITGKKVEMFSIPWRSVRMWSTENAGKLLDVDTELQLWTTIGNFKINLSRAIDIREIDRLVSNAVLRA